MKLKLKTKCIIIALVAAFALLTLLVIVYTRRELEINVVLSRAGFAKLPESARNFRIDSQGHLFDRRVKLVRFEADPEDIRLFVKRHSSVTQPSGRGIIQAIRRTTRPSFEGIMEVRYHGIVYPSWWLQWDGGRPQRSYFVHTGRYTGFATIGNENSMIYIQLARESPLLRKIKRYIPFI